MPLNRPSSDRADQADRPAGLRHTLASVMTDRRRFLGYLVAAPTLAAAAELGLSAQRPAAAAIPSAPQPPEI
jgi:hypothetical protein